MKQCILHLGMPKTASTSIQATLAENRSFLESLGWVYPEFSCPQHGHPFPLHNEPLCRLFFPMHPFHVQREVINGMIDLDIQQRELTMVLDNYCKESSNLILSSEALLRPLPLQRIKRFLTDRGYAIEPIVYVRAPFSYRTSLYQSLLKFSQFPESSIIKHLQAPLVTPGVKAALETFNESVKLYPFDHFRATGVDIVRHFFAHFLTASQCDKISFKRENESLSRQATSMLGYIEEKSPLYIDNIKNPARHPGDIRPLHRLAGEKFRFTPKQLSLYHDILAWENRWLTKNLGAEFSDSDQTGQTISTPLIWGDESVQSFLSILPELPHHVQFLSLSYLETRTAFESQALEKNTYRQIHKILSQTRLPLHAPAIQRLYLLALRFFPFGSKRGRLARKIYRKITERPSAT